MNQTFKAVYFILKTFSTNDYLSHYKSFTAENFENSSLPKSLVITGHRRWSHKRLCPLRPPVAPDGGPVSRVLGQHRQIVPAIMGS